MASKPQMFFGFPSHPPLLRETMANAVELIRSTDVVEVQSWEHLRVGGRFIIDEITKAIKASVLAAFDMTGLNPNVMFELGYAIGAERLVWLLMDTSDTPTRHQWDNIRVLTTIGYSPYGNAEDVRTEFLREQPQLQSSTIFQTAVEPNLLPAKFASVFYVKSIHETEAERALSRALDTAKDRGFRIIIADQSESVYALSWYAQQIYASQAVVVHFVSPRRDGASAHNARCSLIAGLAHGMGRPLLMMAEEGYESPIDFRDLLYVYSTARACAEHAIGWLAETLEPIREETMRRGARRGLRLATELKSLRLGEDVAENEGEELESYFVETAGYLRVLERKTTLFVGRKGTGKTANLLRASAVLEQDRRNLVCVVKPPGYEVDAVARLLSGLVERDVQSYVVEALWMYLLYTEIALTVIARGKRQPAGIQYGSPEWELQAFCENPANRIHEDFAVRLDHVVQRLLDAEIPEDLSRARGAVAAQLYASLVSELRPLLGQALDKYENVVVLVDNLDKAWDRLRDLKHLPSLIFGLLLAVDRLSREFPKRGLLSGRVSLSIAAFLRSDIWAHVARAAREPDKLPVSRLVWSDPALLLRVVEERYVAAREGDASGDELWDRFFPPIWRGQPAHTAIQRRVLPRPRDIVHFCNDAITVAVNAGHDYIQEEDLERADQMYSQFAVEALRVEDGVTLGELEEILYGFVGARAIMRETEAMKLIEETVGPERSQDIVRHLKAFSFLGVEVEENEFRFSEDPHDLKKAEILARRRNADTAHTRVAIHPAYRAFLEIEE